MVRADLHDEGLRRGAAEVVFEEQTTELIGRLLLPLAVLAARVVERSDDGLQARRLRVEQRAE